MSNSDDERRFIDLERRLAHFERVIDDLSDVVAAQADQIDAQAGLIKMLRRQILNLDAGLRAPQDEAPPPHY